MNNLFKPYDPDTQGFFTANPPPDQEEEETKKPKSTPAKSEGKSSTKTTKQEPKPKAASNESKSPSATDTQPQKSKPFPTATEQDGFMHPQSGFSLDPKKEPEPIKAPEKSKGLMIQPQPPQKTILGMKYDPPKPVQPTVVKSPEEAGGRNWFLEELLGDDYTTKFNKHPTPDDPFLQGLYGVEEPKHHTDEPSTPQKFVSKTQPIDKFMGVTPSAPFDRLPDNPQYNQPPLPPKPEGGAPKDYVHNPEGKKTYDFRNPHLSALDYVFGKNFKPIEWKQGIDSSGKLGYDGNRDIGELSAEAVIALANGFSDFFKGQWQTIKGAATDPVGAYIDYMKDPWNYFLPGKLLKDQITDVTGIWTDVLKGNTNGLAYRLGQKTALGVEMLAVNTFGKVVDKYIVKSDGSLEKPSGMETVTKAADASKGVGKAWGTADDLVNSATTPGKGGVSPVGRAFQKHAGNPNRAGTFVGDVSGNAAKNTEQGARYVSEILNNPKSTYKTSHSNVFGDILDVRLPDGTGARWSADGKRFIMFLEKYTH